MKRVELRDKLIDRVGWKNEGSFELSSENKKSESGRYFQDEHSFITLNRIHAVKELDSDNDNSEFDNYLENLRKIVVMTVIDEVFLDPTITLSPLHFENNLDLFDSLISKRMAMKIAEIVFSTTRTNVNERFSKDSISSFYFDINGDKNFPDKISLSSLYSRELDYLKDFLNTERALDTHTLGSSTKTYKHYPIWYESY